MKKVYSLIKLCAIMLVVMAHTAKSVKARIYDEPSKLKMFETQDKDHSNLVQPDWGMDY